MKTGLITFYRPERMESVLRTIAIEKKVEMLGGDCEVISYHPDGQPAQPARKQRGKDPSVASRVAWVGGVEAVSNAIVLILGNGNARHDGSNQKHP